MRKKLCVHSGTSIQDCVRSLDDFSDETRLVRIDGLRKAVAENTYHVRTADVARKIIDYMVRFRLDEAGGEPPLARSSTAKAALLRDAGRRPATGSESQLLAQSSRYGPLGGP